MLRQSTQRFVTSAVHRRHYEEGLGKNLALSVKISGGY
ncbi:unnamed protein product [Nyctereutes procyonoides]|uniref:(raccoon dog) hypothetical protein n=1 Tax=Nyctereutes procyonoides TaxID=34880 RepID=A0A811YG66_NYCPR|nr:unnamed protein product [Nyctereutes procyonoides]